MYDLVKQTTESHINKSAMGEFVTQGKISIAQQVMEVIQENRIWYEVAAGNPGLLKKFKKKVSDLRDHQPTETPVSSESSHDYLQPHPI